ncbi:MAG TPA: T9SS type A sorting domain-containing protein, partial [Ignavibacteriaceae bacterium]|nr:T9SS type A sorting domain-containing protein [Ignavibacteriaceae bacterium]
IEDGEGGVIVSYQDNEWIPPSTSKRRVRVQRVDSSGNFLWGQTGVRVTLSETYPQGGQNLCTDGNGGCVIVWHELHESLPTNTYDIKVNKINNLGERVWGDSGISLENTVNSDPVRIVSASDGNYYVQMSNIYRINQNGQILYQYSSTALGQPVSDPEGGVVLSGRVWTGMIPKLVSQRKDSLGNNLWQEPHVEIADSLYINSPINVKRINGYYYYWWYGRKNGVELVTQYQALRSDGTKLFNQDNLPISNYPVDALIGNILPSDSGTFVLIWQDYRPDDGVFGQRRDTLSNPLWNSNDVPLYTGMYSDLLVITDGIGGAIGLGWHQFDFSLRAFEISKYGNLGEVIIPVELISFSANLTKDKVELFWQTATETNNAGFEVLRFAQNDNNVWKRIGFVEGFGTTTEPVTYSFIDEDVTTGTYKYRLKQIDLDGTFEYSNEIVVEVDFKPKEFVLHQNYPNPFNAKTIIKYQIPKEERLRINIYNILGEKILTLYEGEQKAGEFQVILSSDELPSGNYFYSLETISTRQIKKLTIIK